MQSTSGQHMCSLSNNIHTNYRVCGSTYGVHMAKRDCGLCSCVVSTYFSESCLSIVRVTKLCPTHHPRVHGYERDPNEYHNNNHNWFRYVIGWVRTQPTGWLLQRSFCSLTMTVQSSNILFTHSSRPQTHRHVLATPATYIYICSENHNLLIE